MTAAIAPLDAQVAVLGHVEWIEFAPVDQYTLQGDAMSAAVLGLVPLAWGIDDSIANMAVIDALFASGRSGRWEHPASAH